MGALAEGIYIYIYIYIYTYCKTKGLRRPERTEAPLHGVDLDEIAHSRFVVAPNGDRPECYRHYGSVALGP
jgi:hypothetical protein